MPIGPKRPPAPRMPRSPPLGIFLSRVVATLSACAWVRVPSPTSPLSALLIPASRLVTGFVEVLADAGVMATAPTAPVARMPERIRPVVRLCMVLLWSGFVVAVDAPPRTWETHVPGLCVMDETAGRDLRKHGPIR